MAVRCPYCAGIFGEKGLAGHIRMMHPDEFVKRGYSDVMFGNGATKYKEGVRLKTVPMKRKPVDITPLPEEVNTTEEVENMVEERKPQPEMAGNVAATTEPEPYTCEDCGALLVKGQLKCRCGSEPDWDAIE